MVMMAVMVAACTTGTASVAAPPVSSGRLWRMTRRRANSFRGSITCSSRKSMGAVTASGRCSGRNLGEKRAATRRCPVRCRQHQRRHSSCGSCFCVDVCSHDGRHRVSGTRDAGAQRLCNASIQGPGVLSGIDGSAQHRNRVATGRLVQRGQALGLVGKIFIKGAARHAGLAHDVGNGGVGIALGGHGAGHAFEQAGAVFVAWGGGVGSGSHGKKIPRNRIRYLTVPQLTCIIQIIRYCNVPTLSLLPLTEIAHDRTCCPPSAD